MAQFIVDIPYGFPDKGRWIHSVKMRQFNGYDEEYLADSWSLPIPIRTTEFLGRIVMFERVQKSDNREIIKRLTVGDRVALILHTRRLIFGDKLECVLICPDCKEEMSFTLSVNGLLQPVMLEPQSEYAVKAGSYDIKIRPVTGADLEALFEDDEPRNAERIIRSCITSSDPLLPEKLTDDFMVLVSSKLSELDPQADLILELSCPYCEHSFQNTFDAEYFLFQEVKMRQNQLEQEVHWLAFNYHWSEDEILSLPITKRKRYVELINRTLSGEGA